MEFQTYYSAVELAIDFENALDLKPKEIDGLWYMFKITDYIYQTTCPIMILLVVENDKMMLNIQDIVETLDYIPEIKLQNKELQDCLSKKGNIGIIDINNKLGFEPIGEKHYQYIMSFIDYFQNKGHSISIPEQVKSFNCVAYDKITFVDSKFSALAKIYSNEIEKEDTILQVKPNDISNHWVGMFWIYNKVKEFPPEESIAYVKQCEKCGNNFIANWARDVKFCNNCQ